MLGQGLGEIVPENRELARTYQYSRYLTALLLPRHHRNALIILAAYAGELQRIPFVVSEPMIGQIRLQWWRDVFTAAADRRSHAQATGHPLADAVIDTARTCALPFGLLQGMIDAAEIELDASLLADAKTVDQILNKSEGALFELTGRVLGSQASRDVWQQAAHAYGYARLAAESSWRERVGAQTYITSDMGNLAGSVDDFVGRSKAGLGAVRARYSTLDRATQGALLPLSTVAPLSKAAATALKQSDGRIAGVSQFSQARALLWAHWRRRV